MIFFCCFDPSPLTSWINCCFLYLFLWVKARSFTLLLLLLLRPNRIELSLRFACSELWFRSVSVIYADSGTMSVFLWPLTEYGLVEYCSLCIFGGWQLTVGGSRFVFDLVTGAKLFAESLCVSVCLCVCACVCVLHCVELSTPNSAHTYTLWHSIGMHGSERQRSRSHSYENRHDRVCVSGCCGHCVTAVCVQGTARRMNA